MLGRPLEGWLEILGVFAGRLGFVLIFERI